MSEPADGKMLAVVLGVIALAAVIGVVFTLSQDDRPVVIDAGTRVAVDAGVAVVVREDVPRVVVAADAGCAHCREPELPTVAPALPRGVDLSTPENAIASQVELLRNGRDEDFLATMLPSQREGITPAMIAECREDMRRLRYTVTPAWDLQVRDTERGRNFVRVPMLRRTGPYTTFYEVEGRWYADWAWCRVRADN